MRSLVGGLLFAFALAGCSNSFNCRLNGTGCPNDPSQSSAAPEPSSEGSGSGSSEDCAKAGTVVRGERECCSGRGTWPEDQMSYAEASQKGLLVCAGD